MGTQNVLVNVFNFLWSNQFLHFLKYWRNDLKSSDRLFSSPFHAFNLVRNALIDGWINRFILMRCSEFWICWTWLISTMSFISSSTESIAAFTALIRCPKSCSSRSYIHWLLIQCNLFMLTFFGLPSYKNYYYYLLEILSRNFWF